MDAAGLPLAVILTPGQAGDNPQLLPLLHDIDIDIDGQRVQVGRVIADKAYAHPSTRGALRTRKIKATIPERSDQRQQIWGFPGMRLLSTATPLKSTKDPSGTLASLISLAQQTRAR